MAIDYEAVGAAIAARFAAATPPSGETALVACSDEPPNQIGLTPALYVFPPTDGEYQWGPSAQKWVTVPWTARLFLEQLGGVADRTARLAKWRGALENAIVGQIQLGLAYVDWAELRSARATDGAYGDVAYDVLELNVVTQLRETVTAAA